jgi:hypothetical protein
VAPAGVSSRRYPGVPGSRTKVPKYPFTGTTGPGEHQSVCTDRHQRVRVAQQTPGLWQVVIGLHVVGAVRAKF